LSSAHCQHVRERLALPKAAFPDLNPRFHHFRADPLDAGRVWFTSQASGTDGAVRPTTHSQLHTQISWNKTSPSKLVSLRHSRTRSDATPSCNGRQASGTDSGSGFLGGKPTGKAFSTPPQACSLKFDDSGLAIKYTIGHVMERSLGNTGGLGGIFGPAYAIGRPLPFPEARPWRPSKRYRLLQAVGQFVTFLNERKK